MLTRRSVLHAATVSLAGAALLQARSARAEETPGVTDTEIKFGQTMSYSGPASAYGNIGRVEAAYFRMVNDTGGINGRKLDFISVDDGYSPPKTVEQTRRLVEQDKVAFIFQSLGTAANSAIYRYLNEKKVPHLLIATGSDKFADPAHFPWTVGYNPSTQIEAHIFAKALKAANPKATIAVLYQNDDLGKDYLTGLRAGLGDAASMIVKVASFEVSEPTVDSQVISLKESGADTLFIFASPKFATLTLRKALALDWHPQRYLASVSQSIGSVLKPVGLDKCKGITSTTYGKDPTDPHWKDDPGVKRWHAFMDKYMPGANRADIVFAYGYSAAQTMVQILKQCGSDLSRDNLLRQATNIKGFVPDLALPGATFNTSSQNYHLIQQLQLVRFDGRTWQLSGGLLSG